MIKNLITFYIPQENTINGKQELSNDFFEKRITEELTMCTITKATTHCILKTNKQQSTRILRVEKILEDEDFITYRYAIDKAKRFKKIFNTLGVMFTITKLEEVEYIV